MRVHILSPTACAVAVYLRADSGPQVWDFAQHRWVELGPSLTADQLVRPVVAQAVGSLSSLWSADIPAAAVVSGACVVALAVDGQGLPPGSAGDILAQTALTLDQVSIQMTVGR